MPNVSVIIPAHNCGRTIAAAIQSAYAQTYRDFEVIVVDDGSTDDTRARVAEWGQRVTWIGQPGRTGGGRARNAALRHAHGRYIAFLDAADVWLPRKLDRQIAYLDAHANAGLVHTATIVSRTPARAALHTTDALPVDAAGVPPGNMFADLFHGGLDIAAGTALLRRSVLDDVGPFDEALELAAAEWDLWLRIAARFPIGYLPIPLAVTPPRRLRPGELEDVYRGQRTVIARVRELCRSCERHAGAPDECVRERAHHLATDLGHYRFASGRMREARTAYREAVQLNSPGKRARLYYASTFIGPRWVGALTRLGRGARHAPVRATRTPHLTHDTVYRRTRSALVNAVHHIDEAAGALAGAKRRVLFEAASPMSLAVFGPVLDVLRRDSRIELWFTTSDGAWDAASVFGRAGITERVLPASSVRWMKFDAYVNTDFWNMTWLPRRSQRIHLFHGVAGKYDLDAPTRVAPVVATFDRLLFPNRDRLKRYVEAGLVEPDGPAAALVGYPKVDCLVDGSLNAAAIQNSLGLDQASPTILYAPTWSPHSSLNSSGESIIRALSRLGGNVVVKLHDRSYDQSTRASGGIDWRRRIEALCVELGVHLAQEFDASPYLYIADALVTDHSSVGFEYMLLDRPVIVIDCPDLLVKARVSRQKANLLRSAADVVTAENVAVAVQRALAEPTRHSTERRAIADELFYCPGSASARAADCIYDVLALSNPHADPVREAADAPATLSALET